jgi:hypothetical protein
MARKAYPDVGRLYVDVPEHLGRKGRCSVHDLDKEEILGNVLYEAVPVDGRPVLKIELNGATTAIAMPRVNQALHTSITTMKFGKMSEIDPKLMAQNCTDVFELGKKVALLIATELKKNASRDDVVRWIDKHGFPYEMLIPTLEGLGVLGYEINSSSFNIKTANSRFKYKEYQRVRIVSPMSMDHQECGRIFEARGGGKDPEWYLVLVDGSEKPLWFPELSLTTDDAGKALTSGCGEQ